MVAQAHTFTLDGPEARHVVVEVDVRAGLPAFTIVGLADAAVREARERVQTAILNSGFEFPPRRITANLAPGDVRKAGPGLDLALACAILAATGQVPRRAAADDRDVRRARARRERAPRARHARGRRRGTPLPAARSWRSRHRRATRRRSSRASRSRRCARCAARRGSCAAGPADPPARRASRLTTRREGRARQSCRYARAGPRGRARPARCRPRAADRGGRRAQPAAERSPRRRQDDARPARCRGSCRRSTARRRSR